MTVFLLRHRASKKRLVRKERKKARPPSAPSLPSRAAFRSFQLLEILPRIDEAGVLQNRVKHHLRMVRGLDVGRHDSFNMAYTYATKDAFITAATLLLPSEARGGLPSSGISSADWES